MRHWANTAREAVPFAVCIALMVGGLNLFVDNLRHGDLTTAGGGFFLAAIGFVGMYVAWQEAVRRRR